MTMEGSLVIADLPDWVGVRVRVGLISGLRRWRQGEYCATTTATVIADNKR